MSKKSLTDIARHFCVSDIPGATIPSSRLSGILETMHAGRSLSALSLKYLQDQQLVELHLFATGQLEYDAFVQASARSRELREQAAEAERLASEARRIAADIECAKMAQEQREVAEAARTARERDPKYIARKRNRELREKYDLDFVGDAVFAQVMTLLKKIDAGNRLGDDDILWLKTTGNEFFTDKLRAAYHLREAEHFFSEFAATQDPWSAINASGHFRKCGLPERALEVLDRVPSNRLKGAKMNSAICTTRGGAMRDMGRLDEAHSLGLQGHKFMQQDFRPCTLLGAVNMELGNYEVARDWYTKAEERGASRRSIDSELRVIFLRADETRRESFKAFLLAVDPDRYAWVNARK